MATAPTHTHTHTIVSKEHERKFSCKLSLLDDTAESHFWPIVVSSQEGGSAAEAKLDLLLLSNSLPLARPACYSYCQWKSRGNYYNSHGVK